MTEATIGKDMDQILKYFGLTVKYLQSFSATLDRAIGDGKLIIFVDDLDRCSVDNVIDMLEAIRLLFNANKAKFIVGVDLAKLERAWVLKQKGQPDALDEGKEHLDKIFQLKLALPPKDENMVREYIKTITKTLPSEVEGYLVRALPHNPRKIKRALNLAYFILSGIQEGNFHNMFPYVLAWSILVTAFPEVAKQVRIDPQVLIHLCSFARMSDNSDLQRKVAEIRDTDIQVQGRRLTIYNQYNIKEAYHPVVAKILESDVADNPALYRFLLNTRDGLGINEDPTKSADKVEALRKTINYAGLIS